MIDHNKNIWLLVDEPLLTFDDGTVQKKWRENGYLPIKENMYSLWYNSQSVDKTFKKNLDHSSIMGNRNVFKNTSITITASGSLNYICKSIFGCKSLRVDYNTYQFHKNDLVHYFSKKYKDDGRYWNFVTFDFMEWQPYLNKFLIGINFDNYDLTITSAVVQSKNNPKQVIKVDNMTSKHIVRGNSLWIVDFKKDLGINFSSGQIAIGYTFTPNDKNLNRNESPKSGIAAFAFTEYTRFLLNFYNHKSHGTVWEYDNHEDHDTTLPGSIGHISDGNIFQDSQMPLPGNPSMVMEYEKRHDGIVYFKLV